MSLGHTDHKKLYDFSNGFRIIGTSESVFRQVVGFLTSITAAVMFYSERISYSSFAGWELAAILYFNTGRRYQCGMVIRGLWNIDGVGFTDIPEEYREYAETKKAEFLRDTCTISAVVISASYMWLFAHGKLTLETGLALANSFIWVFSTTYTMVMAAPARSGGSCS